MPFPKTPTGMVYPSLTAWIATAISETARADLARIGPPLRYAEPHEPPRLWLAYQHVKRRPVESRKVRRRPPTRTTRAQPARAPHARGAPSAVRTQRPDRRRARPPALPFGNAPTRPERTSPHRDRALDLGAPGSWQRSARSRSPAPDGVRHRQERASSPRPSCHEPALDAKVLAETLHVADQMLCGVDLHVRLEMTRVRRAAPASALIEQHGPVACGDRTRVAWTGTSPSRDRHRQHRRLCPRGSHSSPSRRSCRRRHRAFRGRTARSADTGRPRAQSRRARRNADPLDTLACADGTSPAHRESSAAHVARSAADRSCLPCRG